MALFEMGRSLWGELRRKKPRRRGVSWEQGQGAWSRPEALEARLAPAVSTWSGAIDGLWSNAGNWDVPPASNNDLVFPAGATNLSTANDLAAGTTFGSMTVAAS